MSPSCQQHSALDCLQRGLPPQLVAAWPWSGTNLSELLPPKAEGVKSEGRGSSSTQFKLLDCYNCFWEGWKVGSSVSFLVGCSSSWQGRRRTKEDVPRWVVKRCGKLGLSSL